MLQFALSVKEIKSRLSLVLLPILLWLIHSYLATKFEIVENRGISFGINLPLEEMFLVMFLVMLLTLLVKNFKWSIYLVFIGGLINFADRLFFGFVRDYFKVLFFYNNLADWVIFVGVILYVVNFFDEKSRYSL